MISAMIAQQLNLFDQEVLLNDKDYATNNFASGHYTVGKGIIHKVCGQTRKLIDVGVQGFVVNHHSVGGDTGSGLGAFNIRKEGC